MRHRKRTFKIASNCSHTRCLLANMLKSLITHERIETSVAKAKELRRYADSMITLAKKNTLASRRDAIGRLMIRFNSLSSKEARAARDGDTSAYNDDRLVISKLFDELGTRFVERQGGYTRIIKKGNRAGDGAERCFIEYLAE
ncbi:MAG: large subunit ribosomal protein L17 [Chlamydiales bacterium]|jgi:large subunit ribosomal protein L17